MDVSKLTTEQIQEAMKELRAKRDEIIVELGTLSIELLARQPPNQAIIYPFITPNLYEGF